MAPRAGDVLASRRHHLSTESIFCWCQVAVYHRRWGRVPPQGQHFQQVAVGGRVMCHQSRMMVHAVSGAVQERQ